MGKILVIVGFLIVLLGILLILKVPVPFGRLPGDITIKTGSFQFYFPLVSCIVLSLLFSFLYYLFFGQKS